MENGQRQGKEIEFAGEIRDQVGGVDPEADRNLVRLSGGP